MPTEKIYLIGSIILLVYYAFTVGGPDTIGRIAQVAAVIFAFIGGLLLFGVI